MALALSCTVDELLDRVSSKEMQSWIAFDAVEPIGYWRSDYNTAMLCAMYANANRKKGAQAFKPLDFMPFMPENKEDDIENVLAKFQALAAASAKAP